jgi:CRP-like cAMP-binding protein
MNKDANPDAICNTLSHVPLFQSLDPEQLTEIGKTVQDVRLNKGATLFRAGEQSHGFYVVAFGQIKLCITTQAGDEKIVEIIGPRQSFGEAVMFLNRPYPVTASSLSDTWLLKIPRQSVDHLLETDPNYARSMLGGLSQRLHSLVQDVEAYSTRSSAQRVIGYLLQHCPENGTDRVDIALPTSKLVIASRLNLTPETLSRVFQELQRNRLIDVQGRSIEIPNPQLLREFLG